MPDGLASRPALRFAGDPIRGLSALGPDQIALVCGGQTQALLSTGALQVDVPVSGTGTKAPAMTQRRGGSCGSFRPAGSSGSGWHRGKALARPWFRPMRWPSQAGIGPMPQQQDCRRQPRPER